MTHHKLDKAAQSEWLNKTKLPTAADKLFITITTLALFAVIVGITFTGGW